jgi:hypothetical protein
MNPIPNDADDGAAGAEDPALQSSRREALIAGAVWVAACVWTVGYCTTYGYGDAAAGGPFVLGFPRWVFVGVVAPWLACIAFNGWFSHWVMKDCDLEDSTVERRDVPDEAEELHA